jgi:hypothetical protein
MYNLYYSHNCLIIKLIYVLLEIIFLGGDHHYTMQENYYFLLFLIFLKNFKCDLIDSSSGRSDIYSASPNHHSSLHFPGEIIIQIKYLL